MTGKTIRQASSPEEASSAYKNNSARWYALILLTIVYAFNFVDRQLLAILQESIKSELGLSDTSLGLLSGFAFALFYVTAGIPIARIADTSNRRNIVAISLFFWSLMTAVCGLAQNFVQLLLARVGVGVGEAGGSPPSHSMISDIFPPSRRATALGFYSTGAGLGVLVGFPVGGWLNELYGWRIAFLAVGLPGVLLAIGLILTMKEPHRGRYDVDSNLSLRVGFGKVISTLWSCRSFIYLAIGAALTGFAGFASSSWSASFMIRSHGMTTGELGVWLAIALGIGGSLGVFSGGALADYLARSNPRWYTWIPSLSALLVIPLSIGTYSAEDRYIALGLMATQSFLLSVYLGNSIATVHALVLPQMRATASAILFFVLNLFGLGAGPWLVGLFSDHLAISHGQESLRLAMLYLLPPVLALSGSAYWLASHYLVGDLDRLKAPCPQ
jgi:predicted MFS family arabinose efflux permease